MHSSGTHENLARATIFIEELERIVVTNQNGDFLFDNLCAGTYTIRISHTSYDSTVRQVTLRVSTTHIDVDLKVAQDRLAEVKITAQRSAPATGIKKELMGRELEETRGLSLAQALGKINGVTLLQTGSTISKPVIHGLHGNRILTINNGVRQEGQQWGNEHAPEIDPFIANRLTVVKGVDELRYGSDAIGGVILVDPRPLRTVPGYNGEFNAMYFTNNRQYVASGIFEHQPTKLSSLTYRIQGTFKKGANVSTPGYRLNNTGSEEKNFSLTAGWRGEHFGTELFYSFFDSKLGIFSGSHIGNLTDLKKAIEGSRPDPVYTGQNTYTIRRPYQDVTHQLIKSRSTLQAGSHNFVIQVAGQYNLRKEFDVVRNTNTTRPQLSLSIFTLSEDISWEHPKKNNFSGVLGLSGIQQDNTYSGRYFIPNYRSYSYGAYFIERWHGTKWDAQAGLRVDHKDINTNRLLARGTTFDEYEFDFSTLASSINVGYKILPHWRINTNLALASRAPHVNELLSNGIHHGTATYEQGNIYLKPEHSFNVSLNSQYAKEDGSFGFDISLYNNDIRNFIFQQPKPEQPVLTIAGAFPQLNYEQADAVLRGADVSTLVKLAKQLEWTSKISILRARNKDTDDWIIRMPADRLTNELTWNVNDFSVFAKTYLSVEMQNVFRQTRVADDANGKQDYKEAPGGYTLLNANFSTAFKLGTIPVTLAIGVNNLLNTSYRDYMNAMRYFTDEMGRNVHFRIRIPIEQ